MSPRRKTAGRGSASWTSSVVNLVNTIVGAGVLAMPHAMSNMGVALGILVILWAALTSGFGLYLQTKCARYLERGGSSFFALSQITYPNAAILFDGAIAVKCFGVGVSYLIIIGDLMPGVAKGLGWHEGQAAYLVDRHFWVTAFMLIVIPLSFLRRLDSLKYTSLVALVSIAYLVVLVVYHFAAGDTLDRRGEVNWMHWQGPVSSLASFPIIVFAYTCHQNMFSVLNEIADDSPRNTASVVVTSVGSAAAIYVLVAITGYLSFGSAVAGNIVSQYIPSTASTIGRAAIVVLVVFSYPLQVHPCRASVDAVLRWRPRKRTSAANNDSNQREEMSEVRFAILTTAIIVLSYACAVTINSLDKVLAYVGSTGSTCISFILPGLFYYKISSPDSPHHQRLLKDEDEEYESPTRRDITTPWVTKSRERNQRMLRDAALALAVYGVVVMVAGQCALAIMPNPPDLAAQAAAESIFEQAGAALSGDRDGHTLAGQNAPLDPPADNNHVIPPPAYGEHYGQVKDDESGLGTDARVGTDGRVNIRISQKDHKLANLLHPVLKRHRDAEERKEPPPGYIPGDEGVPPMNVVVHVVGSQGDVQPFVALGKALKERFDHRVRLATHPVFQDFVTKNGLEFFSIGADPAELMAFMVKNPGLMPGFDTLRRGEVGKRRREVAEYIKGCWRSCYEAGNGLGAEANDKTVEDWSSHRPFVADCIVANPPSFAHIHCAEKLGIPLHIMFTMPYSPTQEFPHPLANIQSSNADPHLTNYISYGLVDMLTWQGLGDVVNTFRTRTLGLEPLSLMWAPGILQKLRIPHTYCWSPSLIPKPKDWGPQISVSGFFFLKTPSAYTPSPSLQRFLSSGPPPIYIGFGSIVISDPNAMTQLILAAVHLTGQRALISQGWGGLGAADPLPDNIFMLDSVPHDWLFQHVSCVIHHGGAGTTAAGIAAGKPTVIVPFFGDQMFWGSMVSKAGAGPPPIPHKSLTATNLADAIKTCLHPDSVAKARELSRRISCEDGTRTAAETFHRMLDLDSLRCSVFPAKPAVWRVKRTQVRLSAFAACTLAKAGLLDFSELKLFRAREYEVDQGPYGPIIGGATAILGTMGAMAMGLADMPVETLKALKIHPEGGRKRQASSPGGTGNDDPGSGDKKKASPGGTGKNNDPLGGKHERRPTSPGRKSFNVHESLAKIRGRSPRHGRAQSADPGGRSVPAGGNAVDTALHTASGIQKILSAGLSSPLDFTLSLTKGFHNMPKLYGDETVRTPDKVVDFKSGIKTAGKEFGLNMYDGISGLVTQPARGFAKEGAAGLLKGFGRGVGGVILKPGAAVFGIPAYTMQGVAREVGRLFGVGVEGYVIAARVEEGYREWSAATEGEKAEVVRQWNLLKEHLKKKKNPDEVLMGLLRERRRKRREHFARWRGRCGDRECGFCGRNAEGEMTEELVRGANGQEVEEEEMTLERLEERDLATAIQNSLDVQEREASGARRDDEDLEAAIRESLRERDAGVSLQGTRREDFERQHRNGEKSQQELEEERVVLEYVKKQSLLEKEYREKM
ncbi:glycosyltransferase family 1 protein [Piedraia hortae CBS 480.64]|uniref:Glycosyltransferase family 1 protein n=1 Tax=Piedraia hortae CBS 480.64 TaxID=1314780 RepID=A0A6A7C3Q5_9PEZI|nr:glycosyltransferase family 1 protein [Piedraia hortae CBS 480.64]